LVELSHVRSGDFRVATPGDFLMAADKAEADKAEGIEPTQRLSTPHRF